MLSQTSRTTLPFFIQHRGFDKSRIEFGQGLWRGTDLNWTMKRLTGDFPLSMIIKCVLTNP
jgi:hypothetical protein